MLATVLAAEEMPLVRLRICTERKQRSESLASGEVRDIGGSVSIGCSVVVLKSC